MKTTNLRVALYGEQPTHKVCTCGTVLPVVVDKNDYRCHPCMWKGMVEIRRRRMKTIEFKKCPCGECHKYTGPVFEDASGSYVKAEVADSLLACLKKASSSLEDMIDCACDDDCRPNAVLQLEIAQKTIKQAEEE